MDWFILGIEPTKDKIESMCEVRTPTSSHPITFLVLWQNRC